MADYDWFDREPNPFEIEAKRMRPLGFVAMFRRSSIGKVNGIDYYLCRRGCGTVVWNPEIHMKNVCPTFEPVAGSE